MGVLASVSCLLTSFRSWLDPQRHNQPHRQKTAQHHLFHDDDDGVLTLAITVTKNSYRCGNEDVVRAQLPRHNVTAEMFRYHVVTAINPQKVGIKSYLLQMFLVVRPAADLVFGVVHVAHCPNRISTSAVRVRW